MWLLVSGTMLVQDHPAVVLFDSGASHCYLSSSFVASRSIPVEVASEGWSISTGNGSISTKLICKSCPVTICAREFKADFLVIEMPGFDVVFGMNWMALFHASIDCRAGKVIFRIPGHPEFAFARGEKSVGSAKFRARPREKLIAVLQSDPFVDVVEPESVKVVKDFPDVFQELPGFPPDRFLEFSIDLVPGTSPISKSPHRMSPLDLRELKAQIEDYLQKGFIRPSVSPWVLLSCWPRRRMVLVACVSIIGT